LKAGRVFNDIEQARQW